MANLPTDLSLAISNTVSHQAFHVMMILLLITFTILFCHSIIRLSMAMLRRARDEESGVGIRGRTASEEYAQPEQPIRVVLARDEEIGISGTSNSLGATEGPTLPPPAYGLWRCSVVSSTVHVIAMTVLRHATESRPKPSTLAACSASCVPTWSLNVGRRWRSTRNSKLSPQLRFARLSLRLLSDRGKINRPVRGSYATTAPVGKEWDLSHMRRSGS